MYNFYRGFCGWFVSWLALQICWCGCDGVKIVSDDSSLTMVFNGAVKRFHYIKYVLEHFHCQMERKKCVS